MDAMFAAQTEARMVSQWLGRNGLDGHGGAWPIKIGGPTVTPLAADYWSLSVGADRHTGKSVDVAWMTVGHGSVTSIGHGID